MWLLQLRSETFKQSFTVCWCHVKHCYQAIKSKCTIHTFTLSHHIQYVFTLVSLLVFTSLMQPFLLGQHFLLWRNFREEQSLQEASVMLLPLFLWHSHLLCWGFVSLVYLVLPYSIFYIFTFFWIYICF